LFKSWRVIPQDTSDEGGVVGLGKGVPRVI
jgi:hypothetical protein